MKAHRRPRHPLLQSCLLLACLLAACGRPYHTAGRHGPPALQVVGQGEVNVAPDIARTGVGVEARAATPTDAADAVNQRMQAVITALLGAGVAREDLQTSQLSLYFEREREPHPPQPRPLPRAKPEPGDPEAAVTSAPAPVQAVRGVYRARNVVSVTVRELDRLPTVLAAATAAGAGELHGVNFDVSDRAPHVAEARALAVRAARADAAQLAQLAGVSLGELLSIHDGEVGGGGPGRPMMMMRSEAMSAPPVEQGQMTIRHSVTLHYRIDQ